MFVRLEVVPHIPEAINPINNSARRVLQQPAPSQDHDEFAEQHDPACLHVYKADIMHLHAVQWNVFVYTIHTYINTHRTLQPFCCLHIHWAHPSRHQVL
jgi:hypothetical protein